MNLLLSNLVTLSAMMMWMKHPLSMGMILILQALNTAVMTGYLMKSFFFSYIIVIIMLSGVLVLFIYMASVASNEKFSSSISLTILTMFIFLVMNLNLKMNYMDQDMSCYNQEVMSLIKLFNTTTMYLTMMMIFYLLLTMIVVSNIAKTSEGPLRTSK